MVARVLARTAVLLCLTLSASLFVGPAGAATTTFAIGDVFVGVGSNKVQWRLPDGTLNKTLTTGSSSSITTGMAFDDSGKLYVTGYTSNVVNRFTTAGAANGTFGTGFNSHPESIIFDAAGNAYVGQERGSRAIVKFNAAGTPQASYTTATDANHGTDRIDLATDQCTVYYTGEGKTIRRFNVCTNTQSPNLTTTLPGTAAEDVRVIPGGGVLVADMQAIHRLSDAGAIVQTYDVASRNCWVALALDPTASSFWAADRCASQVYRFDLGGGNVLSTFKTNTKSGSINGLGVSGGATAARYVPPPPPSADLSASLTGADNTTGNEQYTYTAGAANGGPDGATGVGLSLSIDAGQVTGATGSGWTCTTKSQSASCSRSSLASGSSASVTVTVQTPQATAETTTMTGTATVSANEDDPNPANDTATKQTSVGPYGSGMIPPEGGTVSTATTACPTASDPACGSATFPVGPGGFASIAELLQIGRCSLSNCIGPAFEVVPPAGYLDPNDPIEIELVYDQSITPGTGTNYSVWVEKLVGGIPVTAVVPPCQPLGHAVPAPCVNSISRDLHGDLHAVILALSEDPKFQLFGG
jgi:hypothetical protein